MLHNIVTYVTQHKKQFRFPKKKAVYLFIKKWIGILFKIRSFMNLRWSFTK